MNGQNDLQRRMRNRSRHGDSVVDAEDEEEEEQQQEAQLSMQRRPSTSSLRSFGVEPLQPLGFSRSTSNAGFFEWCSPASRLPKKLSHLTAAKPYRHPSSAISEKSFTPTQYRAWQGGKYGGNFAW